VTARLAIALSLLILVLAGTGIAALDQLSYANAPKECSK